MKRLVLTGALALALMGCKKKEEKPVEEPPKQEVKQEVAAGPVEIGRTVADMTPEARAEDLVSGDASKAREVVVWELLQRSALSTGDLNPHAIVYGRDPALTKRPLHLNLGGLRGAALYAAAAKLEVPNVCGTECRIPIYNTVARGLAGGDVFKEAGVIDPQALKKLLDALYVEPDKSLLGATAKDIYPLLRPIVYEFVMTQRAIRVLGKVKAMEEYKAALAQTETDKRAMLNFYKTYATENNLGMLAGLEANRSHSQIAGFWLRRLADGSEPVFDVFFKTMLKDYDQALLDESTRK